ncbi:MAG TPA: hypothetical protein VFM18_17580 [Methanosarcina sp.]|nr:hypothetical protein [Methanosarcina sp.]
MAYMSQEKKAKLAPAIKAILKKYGFKGSLAVRNHSTLVLNIRQGNLDVIGNYNKIAGNRATRQALNGYLDVNEYWYKDHFDGKVLKFFSEVIPAMMTGNHNNSDSMTDYFDVGWYINIHVGQWDRPYALVK